MVMAENWKEIWNQPIHGAESLSEFTRVQLALPKTSIQVFTLRSAHSPSGGHGAPRDSKWLALN
jgi:hypothetical protein